VTLPLINNGLIYASENKTHSFYCSIGEKLFIEVFCFFLTILPIVLFYRQILVVNVNLSIIPLLCRGFIVNVNGRLTGAMHGFPHVLQFILK